MNPWGPLYRIADELRFRRHRDIGKRGEDLAHRFLRKNGFTVVARNWRPPQGGGEIDIIAWEQSLLVFIEVKSRASAAGSAPERDVDPAKIQALQRAARDYVRRCGADGLRVRFDAISVVGRTVEHLRDIFPAAPGPGAL